MKLCRRNINNEVHVLSGSTNNGFEFVKIPGNRSGFDFSSITSHFDLSGDNLPTELGQLMLRGYSFNSTHVYVADKSDTKVWYWDLDQNSTTASLDNGNWKWNISNI